MICFIITIIYLLIADLNAEAEFKIKEPVSPTVQQSINTQTKHINFKNKKKVKKYKKENLYFYNVTILFQDSSILNGVITIKEKTVRVRHKKKDFVFDKTIKWEDVKSIKIKEWKPRLISKNTNNGKLTYYFYPGKYQFIMNNKKSYYYHKNIPYLNSLLLTNDDGSTQIYSFFVDYWYPTGKNTGYWENTKNSYFYYPFYNPHYKSFKIINFK